METREENEPVDGSNPNYIDYLKDSTYVEGVSRKKPEYTILNPEPGVTYTIHTPTTYYNKWKNDIVYGGNTNTHTKPKNRKNKVKRKHK